MADVKRRPVLHYGVVYTGSFMPPTSKKLKGHISFILSVCPLRFLADAIS